MGAAGQQIALALGVLERGRQQLSDQLAAEPAWAAMCQLLAREAAGESLEAVSDDQLKHRLSQTLDLKVANWRQLAGLEAAIAALKAVGIEAVAGALVQAAPAKALDPLAAAGAGGRDKRADMLNRDRSGREEAETARTRGEDSGLSLPEISDDVSAILKRIRSIAPGEAHRRTAVASASSPKSAGLERPPSGRIGEAAPADGDASPPQDAASPGIEGRAPKADIKSILQNPTLPAADRTTAIDEGALVRPGDHSGHRVAWSGDGFPADEPDDSWLSEEAAALGGGHVFEDEAEVEIVKLTGGRRGNRKALGFAEQASESQEGACGLPLPSPQQQTRVPARTPSLGGSSPTIWSPSTKLQLKLSNLLGTGRPNPVSGNGR
ncbi:MAG: hypothetical protein R3D67_07140 [Hyphomicrobiaceae bacterium]